MRSLREIVYTLRRTKYRIYAAKVIITLLIVEISIGVGAFVYASNLYYSLQIEKRARENTDRDLVLQITTNDINSDVSNDNDFFNMADYIRIQEISDDKAFIHIDLPQFIAIDDSFAEFDIVLVDYNLMNLSADTVYWGSDVSKYQNAQIDSLKGLRNDKQLDSLSGIQWKTETRVISTDSSVLVPITQWDFFSNEVSAASVHIEWKSTDYDDVSKLIESVETYMNSMHKKYQYHVNSPAIELRETEFKTKISIKLIGYASLLFIFLYIVGMFSAFHILLSRRMKSFGIALSCGASHKHVKYEIIEEVLIVNCAGVLIGSILGVLATYYLDLQILTGYIKQSLQKETILLDVAILISSSLFVITSLLARIRHEIVSKTILR